MASFAALGPAFFAFLHGALRPNSICICICENVPMTELNTAAHMQALGQQAKKASALMAKASAATKNAALRRLAALLRENTDALQIDNAKDLDRARAAGLAEPLVDRLKLSPKVLETCAQG
jgi:glutamate-5-semialdehyde dehydrogenase